LPERLRGLGVGGIHGAKVVKFRLIFDAVHSAILQVIETRSFPKSMQRIETQRTQWFAEVAESSGNKFNRKGRKVNIDPRKIRMPFVSPSQSTGWG
jgi:hypothetical protein